MSKKRKKNSHNSHNKKKNSSRKKQQSLNWFQKITQKVSFEPVKTFFIELMQKFKQLEVSSFMSKGKSSMLNHKKGIIFALSMTAIIAIGYFTVVNPPTKSEASTSTVSINLEEEQTSFMDDVESEVGNIPNTDKETAVVNLEETLVDSTEVQTEIEEESTAEVANAAVQPSIDVISAANISGERISLEVLKEKPVYDPIEKSMMLGMDMFAIIVDNKEVAYFQSEEEANDVLETLKAQYLAEGAVEERVIFRESIEVAKVKRDIFDCNGFQTAEEILEYIVKGTNEQRIHTVKSGENFWVIAEDYGLNVQDLIDANPGIDEKRLQIDTELSLIVAEPIINIVTISKVERIDPVPYGRGENVKTDKYYQGEYKTKQTGIPGEAEVVLEVYMENGKLLGEKVLDQTVITQPVEQIVYEGTRPAPPKIGTGTYQNPTSRGYITSNFGSRSLGYHNGIDIGIPSGTDVVAADGGIVTYSGYKGTYGKLIMINHGANKETRYAHNSKLLVSSGEKVHKGQLIAYSGNTGRSTGPHLHFEIRINNNPVNPKKYVNY